MPVHSLPSTELWWKHAVFYCMDVETFMDSDGDGVGDFRGLTERVEYLAALGVTALWLLPFFPSSNRDDGYDVIDFYDVDRRFGTLGDFAEFMRAADERGLRVVMDLPINHTSDRHPWFQQAREDRHSPYHGFYVWSDEQPEDDEPVVFPGEVDSNWSYDDVAGQWYFHRFYDFQPDLDIANPAVRRELEKVMGFWLDLGVSGFRIDALPFLLEQPGDGDKLADPHKFVRRFHSYVLRRRGDAMLLGEANVEPERLRSYFGDGDEMHMLYAYPVNASMYLAIARSEGEPVARYLGRMPDIPETSQWLNFIRIHDEISLERLDDNEKEEVFAKLAPDESWRVYDRGVRRRLPPLIGGDPDRLVMLYSLLMSLPGTPCLFYGDEIGMGDQLKLDGRLSVRTPMQWTPGHNAGFSDAPEDRLVRPLVDEADYSPKAVNVAAQRSDGDSMFSWIQRLIAARRECAELGWGHLHLLDTGTPAVLAHRVHWEGSAVLAVHNFTDTPRTVELEDCEKPLTQLIADHPYKTSEIAPGGKLEIAGYGFRWFRTEDEEPDHSPN